MKFTDANQFSSLLNIDTDTCIVGAGVAGITIASELADDSQEACLIESGKYIPDEEVQSLYDFENIGYPVRENFMSRARYYGGTSNLWPGRCMILTEFDLQRRSWVSNSGWPISYSELMHYYAKSTQLLRLPAIENFDPSHLTKGLSPEEEAILKNGNIKPTIAMWAKKPLRFGKRFYPKLRKAANVGVYLNLNATEIRLSDNGESVESLIATRLDGKQISINAKKYVIACGGLENARLLLVSNNQHPKGVGNRYDLVGRYYMDHPRCVLGRVHLYEKHDLSRLLGMPLPDGKMQIGIALSEKIQQREGLLHNYLTLEKTFSEISQEAYHSFVLLMKRCFRKGYAGKRFDFSSSKLSEIPDLIYLLAPREIVPHFAYRWYRALRKKRPKELVVVNYCEQEPNPHSRVKLSRKRDKLNMNLLTLDWKVGSKEIRSLIRIQEILYDTLRKNRIGYSDSPPTSTSDLTFTDASHHMGTTRMSQDPKKGVVDRNCKVHGVNNLYIAGSSVFPTCGHANPTLTIVAISLRLADHIRRVT